MKRQIEIGPLAETLKVQLKGIKIDPEKLDHLERDHQAINRLFVRGYITDRQFDSAGKRLIKAVQGRIGAVAPAHPQHNDQGHLSQPGASVTATERTESNED